MHLVIFVCWLFSLTWEIACYLPWSYPVSQMVFTTVVWGMLVLSLIGLHKLTVICDALLARFSPLFFHFMLIVALSTFSEMALLATGYDPTLIRIPLNIGMAIFIVFWLVLSHDHNLIDATRGIHRRNHR